MAAAGPWVIYNEFKENLGKKLIDLSADSFKAILVASTSNAMSATLATATYATVTNELTTANGYTAGGASVTSSWIRSTGTVAFDTQDISWTASGGTITARAVVLYDNTPATKYLVGYMLLDSTPQDVSISDTNTLTINIANVFTLS